MEQGGGGGVLFMCTLHTRGAVRGGLAVRGGGGSVSNVKEAEIGIF